MNSTPNIQNRLKALPHKISLPFQNLLEAGQIDEETLGLILDAGDLSGDHSKLLGFSIGYFHLRSQGVPVHDVIHMAKLQNRHINLSWSPKRWRQEHDRLSRAEALARLAKEKEQYDVSKYEALLPREFPGYLIRTSRRLGMEGLRQNHCVGSYHSQLKTGSCAIASVFLDKKRWTIQLFATDNPAHPLRIAQIKTRFNGLPSDTVRETIFKILGANPKPQQDTPPTVQTENSSYMDTLRRLLPILRLHNVTDVCVGFDGSGDDGSIYDISYQGNRAFNDKQIMVEHYTTTRIFDDGQWTTRSGRTQNSVYKALEDLTYEYLDETGIDWVNNDGGFGHLEIDVEQGTVSLNIDVRYTESTNEFCSDRNIITGEEM